MNQDGTLDRGAGANSSQNFGDGFYEVIFDRDVSKGAYVATIGYNGDSGTAPAGIVTVVGRITTDAGVWVATYDTNGNRVSQRLRAEGFSEEILAAIGSVARRDGETYEDFVRRAGENPIGRRVKLADLEDNCDLGRIASPTEKDRARVAKYERAIALLEQVKSR